MLEIITPSGKVGWLNWDFFAKSLEAGDAYIIGAVNNMIGFALKDPESKNYYVGDLTEDRKLQYFYGGAYETLLIPRKSVIFYSRTELLSMLCEQYEKATHKTLKLTAIK